MLVVRYETWDTLNQKFHNDYGDFKNREYTRIILQKNDLIMREFDQTKYYSDSVDPLVYSVYFRNDVLNDTIKIGIGALYHREWRGFKIAGIGKMAVRDEYRRNGIGSLLLSIMLSDIKQLDSISIDGQYHHGYSFSLLWASILKFYERFGFRAIYKNVMYLPINDSGVLDTLLRDNYKEIVNVCGVW